jgi:hypothetical protein
MLTQFFTSFSFFKKNRLLGLLHQSIVHTHRSFGKTKLVASESTDSQAQEKDTDSF